MAHYNDDYDGTKRHAPTPKKNLHLQTKIEQGANKTRQKHPPRPNIIPRYKKITE